MTISNDCRAMIDAANAERLSPEEVEALITELDRVKRTYKAKSRLESLDQTIFEAAKEVSENVKKAALQAQRAKHINMIKEADLMQRAQAAKDATGDASLGLEAATVGVNQPFFGSRNSADYRGKALTDLYLGGLGGELEKAGLLAKYNSREYSLDIVKELWDLHLAKPTNAATSSKDAKAIAGTINKYQNVAIERENRAGAWIEYTHGWVTRAGDDPHKIEKAGFDEWYARVKQHVDFEAMKIDPDEQDKFFRDIYDSRVTGLYHKELGNDSDSIFAFESETRNLAKKRSQNFRLIFKSAEDWYNYNELYGRGNLNEVIAEDLRRSAESTALMETFGTNPEFMFAKVQDRLTRQYKEDVQQVRRLNRQPLKWQMAEITGAVNVDANHFVANLFRGVRAWESMAKLGYATLSSLPDLAAVAAEFRYEGRGLGQMWWDALSAPVLGAVAKGETRHTASLMGAGTDGLIGASVSRFTAQDDVPGRMSKLMRTYFKLNLLQWWTDSVKRGFGLMISHDLGLKAGLTWGELDDITRRNLSMYGFDAQKWDLARTSVVEADGRVYMVPSVFGKARSAAEQRRQDEVSQALATYLADRSDYASPTPGARERAIMRFGQQAGTPLGEAARFLYQFKSFPITLTQKILGREVHGQGARSIYDMLFRGQGDRIGLVSFIAGSSVLGYFSLQLKEVAKGREPRPWDQDTVIAAIAQGGGAGFYGDFLLGEAAVYGAGPLASSLGPVPGAAEDFININRQILHGDIDDATFDSVKFIQSNTPFMNLFYTKAAMDYLIFYQLQELANPGYLRRMEQGVKRTHGQNYYLPPSRTVPRGGGTRPLEGVR